MTGYMNDKLEIFLYYILIKCVSRSYFGVSEWKRAISLSRNEGFIDIFYISTGSLLFKYEAYRRMGRIISIDTII